MFLPLNEWGRVVIELFLAALLALVAGLAIGWLVAGRRASALASDLAVAQSRAADAELVRQARDAVERERNDAMQELAGLRAQTGERDAAHQATLAELKQAREAMTAQFGEVASKLLGEAQRTFLERADARFRQ